jgi:hypothetical protein
MAFMRIELESPHVVSCVVLDGYGLHPALRIRKTRAFDDFDAPKSPTHVPLCAQVCDQTDDTFGGTISKD